MKLWLPTWRWTWWLTWRWTTSWWASIWLIAWRHRFFLAAAVIWVRPIFGFQRQSFGTWGDFSSLRSWTPGRCGKLSVSENKYRGWLKHGKGAKQNRLSFLERVGSVKPASVIFHLCLRKSDWCDGNAGRIDLFAKGKLAVAQISIPSSSNFLYFVQCCYSNINSLLWSKQQNLQTCFSQVRSWHLVFCTVLWGSCWNPVKYFIQGIVTHF